MGRRKQIVYENNIENTVTKIGEPKNQNLIHQFYTVCAAGKN